MIVPQIRRFICLGRHNMTGPCPAARGFWETCFMPLARISVPSLLSPAKVRALADAVHHGLVATCDVPDENRFQLVSSYPSGSMILDPTFPNFRRSAEACVIEILLLEGRTTEQKSRLFQTIA